MTLKILVAAGAVSLLTAGAALAQPAAGSGSAATGAVNPVNPAAPPASATTSQSTTTSGVATTTTTTTSADLAGQNASVTTAVVTNGPVPDTPENRAKYGGPMSRAGKRTAPRGN